MKTNIFVLFSTVLELIENQAPNEKQTQLSIIDLVAKIEGILSTDFEIPINKINTEVTENGFNIKEFIEVKKRQC